MAAFPQQRVSIITLGVTDREASTRFYSDVLGFTPFMRDEITMFDMGGMVLGLWERGKLQADVGLMGNTCPPGACPNFALVLKTQLRNCSFDDEFSQLQNCSFDDEFFKTQLPNCSFADEFSKLVTKTAVLPMSFQNSTMKLQF